MLDAAVLRHDGPHVSQLLRSQSQFLLHQCVDATIAGLVPHKQPLVRLQRFLRMARQQQSAPCS